MLTLHTQLIPVTSKWDFPHELPKENLSHMIKLEYRIKQGQMVHPSGKESGEQL